MSISATETAHADDSARINKFLTNVFAYMGIGVLITAIVTMVISNSEGLMESLFSTYQYRNDEGEMTTGFKASGIWWACTAAELAIVVYISWFTNSMKGITAWLAFMVYAALNGVTIAPLIYAYTGASVAMIFFISASVFGIAAAYGLTTKKDLTSLGGFFIVALVSLLVAMVVNMLVGNGFIDMLISAIAVIVFTGLTAYDVQMLKELHREQHGSSEQTLAVYGALRLYLDFINIFIHLLRLFGDND